VKKIMRRRRRMNVIGVFLNEFYAILEFLRESDEEMKKIEVFLEFVKVVVKGEEKRRKRKKVNGKERKLMEWRKEE
jgi:hypothetical protein